VAITFVVIISLITTSFALLSRRESRQALDRQLSTQAFYAAESGINDAIQAGVASLTECDQSRNLSSATSDLDLSNGLSYTCVLVDNTPETLQFSLIDTEGSKVVRVQPTSGAISKLRISWQDFEGGNTFGPASFLFPQQGNNMLNTGVLRANVIPVTDNLSRDSLINNTQTLFLYPASAASGPPLNHDYSPAGSSTQGTIVDGKCNTANINPSPGLPQFCNVEITNLGASGANLFYLRLKSIYRSSNVTVQAFDSFNRPLELTGSQVAIDSTGKANDVLRRVQVRVPVNTGYYVPEFALESSETICKLISTTTSSVVDGCAPYN